MSTSRPVLLAGAVFACVGLPSLAAADGFSRSVV